MENILFGGSSQTKAEGYGAFEGVKKKKAEEGGREAVGRKLGGVKGPRKLNQKMVL